MARLWVTTEGRRIGPLNTERGIRQGDPLSPYLFILCAEGLSRLISNAEQVGLIRGVRVALRAPRVSHLFFADDSFLFSAASGEEAREWKILLQKYEDVSGQKINFEKSSITFSPNTRTGTKQEILTTLGMREESEPGIYLGVPAVMQRSRKRSLSYVKDRIISKLQGWDELFLSKAGKKVLLKSVIQALPTYTMGVYLIPVSLLQEIEVIMNRYWWSHDFKSGKGLRWKSWDRLCDHKAKGGLGFKHLHDFNLAMLGKQGWRLMQFPHSLVARVLKAKYYPDTEYINAEVKQGCSYTWSSLMAGQHVVKMGARRRIKDGKGIPLDDPFWAPVEPGSVLDNTMNLSEEPVASLINEDGKEWRTHRVREVLNGQLADAVLAVPLGVSVREEGWYWWGARDGEYRVREAYKIIQRRNGRWMGTERDEFWVRLWKLKIPPKTKHLVWRVLCGTLPTNTNLRRRGVEIPVYCGECGAEETETHVLFFCREPLELWRREAGVVPGINQNLMDWFLDQMERGPEGRAEKIAMMWWVLWRGRNIRLWDQKAISALEMEHMATSMLQAWQEAQKPIVVSSDVRAHRIIKWVKPGEGEVKVNIDGALLSPNLGSGGMIGRGPDGVAKLAHCVTFQGISSPDLIEAMAVREAMKWTLEMGYGTGILESDSQGVVQAILSSEVMLSPFGDLITECRLFLSRLNSFKIQFVRREANRAAHTIARNALIWDSFDWHRMPIPDVLLAVLNSDLQ